MPETIKKLIRDVPDFPKPGILFKDITPLLADPKQFSRAIAMLAKPYQGKGISKVICVEARGFILGAPVAYQLGAGVIPVRKPGKLPYQTSRVTYALEYGTDSLEMHIDAIVPGEKILVVDDVLATGGTMAAVVELVKKMEGKIVGIAFLLELGFLKGRGKLAGQDIFSLIKY